MKRADGAVARVRFERGRRALDNGLIVLLAPSAHLRRLTLRVWFEVGPCCEKAAQAGLRSLVGHLLEEGAGRRGGAAITRAVEAVGGELSCDHSGISLSVASEHWKLAVDLCADMLRRPHFPAEAFERRRRLAVAELLASEDEPRVQALRGFHRMVYGRHPLARPILGRRASLQSLRRADVVAFHERWYAPQRTIIAAAGGLNDERAFCDHLEQRLGRWRKSAPPAEHVPRLVRGDFPRVAIRRQERSQVNLYMGHLGIGRTDPDYHALKVLDHILGTSPGFTDRLSRRLRDELGLAYSLGASISSSAGREPGALTCYIGTSPEKAQLAAEGILAELRRMRAETVSSEELDLAHSFLAGSMVCALEHSSARAEFLIQQERFGLPEDYLARYPDLIRAVGRAEVQEVARKHLHPEAVQAFAVGPLDDLNIG